MAGIQIIYSGEDYRDFSKKTYFKIRRSLEKRIGTKITMGPPVLHEGYEEINCYFSGVISDKSTLIEKLKKAIGEVEGIDLSKLEIDTIRDR